MHVVAREFSVQRVWEAMLDVYMSPALRSQRAAFTLVEVLTVIGIIAILSAILLPVLGRVRENGRTTQCASNMQQIHRALTQYIADNDSKLPVSYAFREPGGPQPADPKSWPHLLQPYLKSTEVVVCPTARYIAGDDAEFSVGSTYIPGWGVEWSWRQGGLPTGSTEHEAKVSDPSRRPMITDGGTTDQMVDVALPCAPLVTINACILHRGGANVGFFDGHVKWLKPEQHAQTWCDLRKG